MTEPLLRVSNLEKKFPIQRGIFKRTVGHIHAVDGISFEIAEGETLGLVGESGCGKTTAGRTILRLLEPTGGSITYEGEDVTKLSRKGLHEFRSKMQIIFQDPYSSLNPRHTVGKIIAAPFEIQNVNPAGGVKKAVQEVMERVGLTAQAIARDIVAQVVGSRVPHAKPIAEMGDSKSQQAPAAN